MTVGLTIPLSPSLSHTEGRCLLCSGISTLAYLSDVSFCYGNGRFKQLKICIKMCPKYWWKYRIFLFYILFLRFLRTGFEVFSSFSRLAISPAVSRDFVMSSNKRSRRYKICQLKLITSSRAVQSISSLRRLRSTTRLTYGVLQTPD